MISSFSFRFLLGMAAFFVSLNAQAQILDLERANLDSTYRNQIARRFKAVRELQIGGTHITGNRTVIKIKGEPTEELDPRILTINPKPEEHDFESPKILSILGDGFSFELLDQLQKLCELLDFKFTRIYINNVDVAIPIPAPFDRIRTVVYGPQKNRVVHISDPAKHFYSLYRYVSEVTAGKTPNLYSRYFDLLKQGGQLLFKNCEQTTPESTVQGFYTNIDSEMAPDLKEEWKTLYKKTFAELNEKLLKIGDRVDLQNRYPQVQTIPEMIGPHYKIQMQTLLLQNAKFVNITVSAGKFRSWGYFPGVDAVYSLIIGAEKR